VSRYKKSIVASGHKHVSSTAALILREGGNAFDAVVAAGFASAVVEPTLTSLGGGGFLLGHSAKQGQSLFFDFFVDTPGLNRDTAGLDPHFFPVTVNFSGVCQDFNVGLGSVAVPGTLKGLIHTQKRLGRMSLEEVIAPARELAREHVINAQQGHFLSLLYPIMTLRSDGRDLYEPGGVYKKPGDLQKNPDCTSFLEAVARDHGESFYQGEIAARVDRDMKEGDGLLTREDLAAYQVIERTPLKIPYRGYDLLTSPEPSMGGTLIGLSIALLEKLGPYEGTWGDGGQLARTVALMQEVEKLREAGITTPALLRAFIEDGTILEQSSRQIRLFSRGTTHVSIADQDGNCASMTSSNGEGSGYFAPATGVMLNNMMGEDDLHPNGFHSSPPGERVGSMMSPSLLVKDDIIKLVIGSGGSKRIRTAVSQVLSQVVDFGRDLQEAVDAPRLFWDGEVVQVEPGFAAEAIENLAGQVDLNLWDHTDVYFGGVHAVIPGESGAGDPRRGGSVEEVEKRE
jgi:gamma-glutamyltranspeptidase/glutathione hydrolase